MQINHSIVLTLYRFCVEFPFKVELLSLATKSLGLSFTMATSAKLMSLRIMNDTKNPDHDKKYRTNRAGIRSESLNKQLTSEFELLIIIEFKVINTKS